MALTFGGKGALCEHNCFVNINDSGTVVNILAPFVYNPGGRWPNVNERSLSKRHSVLFVLSQPNSPTAPPKSLNVVGAAGVGLRQDGGEAAWCL